MWERFLNVHGVFCIFNFKKNVSIKVSYFFLTVLITGNVFMLDRIQYFDKRNF